MMKIVSDICPEYNVENSIEIEYKEVRMVGDPRTYYKKGSFYCEKANSQGCSLDSCPIYSKAPNSR